MLFNDLWKLCIFCHNFDFWSSLQHLLGVAQTNSYSVLFLRHFAYTVTTQIGCPLLWCRVVGGRWVGTLSIACLSLLLPMEHLFCQLLGLPEFSESLLGGDCICLGFLVGNAVGAARLELRIHLQLHWTRLLLVLSIVGDFHLRVRMTCVSWQSWNLLSRLNLESSSKLNLSCKLLLILHHF